MRDDARISCGGAEVDLPDLASEEVFVGVFIACFRKGNERQFWLHGVFGPQAKGVSV